MLTSFNWQKYSWLKAFPNNLAISVSNAFKANTLAAKKDDTKIWYSENHNKITTAY